jgi:ketosteroid isomerase-like protein
MSDESTTPDLVELTRLLYETADVGDLDAMMRLFARDAVWNMPEEGIETFEGTVAIRRFVEEWQGSYEDYDVEVEDILDLGNGVTFAVSIQKGRPAGSSGVVQIRFAAAHAWVEGLIVRIATYGDDVNAARAAAERLAEERG